MKNYQKRNLIEIPENEVGINITYIFLNDKKAPHVYLGELVDAIIDSTNTNKERQLDEVKLKNFFTSLTSDLEKNEAVYTKSKIIKPLCDFLMLLKLNGATDIYQAALKCLKKCEQELVSNALSEIFDKYECSIEEDSGQLGNKEIEIIIQNLQHLAKLFSIVNDFKEVKNCQFFIEKCEKKLINVAHTQKVDVTDYEENTLSVKNINNNKLGSF